jgi:polysaccharide biosynthesis transport protein
MSNHDFQEDLNRRIDGAARRTRPAMILTATAQECGGRLGSGLGPLTQAMTSAGMLTATTIMAPMRKTIAAAGAMGSVVEITSLHRGRPGNTRWRRPDRPASDLYGRDGLGSGSVLRDDDVAFDFRKYLGILIKNRWLIAGITALSLSVGLVYTLLQAPTYRASATIQIKRAVANISGIAGVEESGREYEFYQTQYELLKSRALAERVVSSLNLADNPALFEPPPSGWKKLHGLVFSRGHAEAPNISQRQGRALGAIRSGLTVEPVRSSSIVRINFDSRDPVLAQKVANAVAENFITSNLERNFEASAYARQFLEERLQELRLKLEESELALVEYAEEQDILTTGSDQTLSTTNLSGVNQALAAAGKERLRHEMQWQQVEAMDGLRLPKALESAAIERLRARKRNLSSNTKIS